MDRVFRAAWWACVGPARVFVLLNERGGSRGGVWDLSVFCFRLVAYLSTLFCVQQKLPTYRSCYYYCSKRCARSIRLRPTQVKSLSRSEFLPREGARAGER